jgi:FixJ family two-component response regulator
MPKHGEVQRIEGNNSTERQDAFSLITPYTVELHRCQIMQKLHAESAVDLARQVFWA